MPRVSAEHVAARRQQILDAALTCFDRNGFHGTSMPDIFREAGLSAGAVYHYFAGKSEIVEAIAAERHATEATLIEQASREPDVRRALHRLTDLYFGWLTDPSEQRRRRVGVQAWAEAVHDPRIREVVQRGTERRRLLVEALEAAGDSPLGLDAEPLSRAYLALLQGFVLQQAWEPDVPVEPYVRAVHALIDATVP